MVIDQLRFRQDMLHNVTHWEVIPPREARYAPLPEELHPDLTSALKEQGFNQLYTHQATAVEQVLAGKSAVVVTPTASGKTLCYNLPVLHTILQNDQARALYIFPTKALAYDQMAELNTWIERTGRDIKGYTYDGDTPASARQAIRRAGNIVVTNPDMLHQAILPHHTKWVKLFENLRYIVIDELHAYRGVFGSHFANVLRRLKRICRHYGADPQFICSSATIANPLSFAETLTGTEMALVDNNGAPSGEKHLVFYNPPVVNASLGIRRSSLLEARRLAEEMLVNDIQTIVFARSRVRVEVLLTYLQNILPGKVRGYRGGYLPNQRRSIERGLRSGEIRGVVSTNALELGIDIGQLEACIICGYPGSIASTWQQAGRAGRRHGSSLQIIVASSNPLDQYVIQHPEYFLRQSPEYALVQPDNLIILVNHIKCAAYELPFERGEQFGVTTTEEILDFLVEENILHRSGDRWYWMDQSFPAKEISLRTADQENVVIIDISETARHQVIGEVDRFSAPMYLHEEAIYLHEGVQYQVEKLDLEEKKAYVRRVNVDYYTDANLAVQLRVLQVDREDTFAKHTRSLGEVTVNALVTLFKKIKLYSHENIGSGPVHLPEQEMHTTAYWVTLNHPDLACFSQNELQSGLIGLSNVLAHLAPLYLMCDPRDIGVSAQIRAVHSKKPTIYLYDKVPGGVGLSDKLFELHDQLMSIAKNHIRKCPCKEGCPSCVGPVVETGEGAKDLTLKLLDYFT
ncbi:DEAD/DEAH box helicase [Paenactinomyces guangxiensis]|uniref:DEAD/DEAH box helicase n=1 Tax=Paenactinomyces guangxiensis TaxID=1490290 RepID=A0A7W2A993_9BACL|nr:DEAD/DEAH box helicase [Paenactinomyces guangxiensis]MBA4494942.1 DEAD/DEAH box helicase [Paenactinomyces guangxiensis]MBH8592025.1 DEAD/DEAH box helicase [Paenactinomyces guangxiensis]